MDVRNVDDLSKHAKSLLDVLNNCHETADLKEPIIKHFLMKLSDGRIETTEQERNECKVFFKNLRSTLIEMSPSVTKVTKLVDDGLKLMEQLEENRHSCKNLKPATYEADVNLLGAELRKEKSRVSADSAIGSIGSNISSRSDFDDSTRSSITATEHDDEAVSVNNLNDLTRSSSTCDEQLRGMDFENLSVGSLQSNSCNEETYKDEVETNRRDPNIGPEPALHPERDSVAFAHAIPEDDLSSIDAQGLAAYEQRRHQNRNENPVIVIKDYDNVEKESDV